MLNLTWGIDKFEKLATLETVWIRKTVLAHFVSKGGDLKQSLSFFISVVVTLMPLL